MALSPARKRQQVFDELYEAASIVPPRPLAELQPLLENNTLLYIGQVFGSIQQAETTVAEYCEVQSRAVVYNGQDGAYKNRTALSARCPQLVQGGTCSFRCRIRGNMRTRRFMCEELDPHNCTVLSTEKAFTGSKRCNYSRHMFAAIPALSRITQDNGAALLAQYTNTASSYLRVLRVREAIAGLQTGPPAVETAAAVEVAPEAVAEEKVAQAAAETDTEEKIEAEVAPEEETETDETETVPESDAEEEVETTQAQPQRRSIPRMLRELQASTPGSVALASPAHRRRCSRKRYRTT